MVLKPLVLQTKIAYEGTAADNSPRAIRRRRQLLTQMANGLFRMSRGMQRVLGSGTVEQRRQALSRLVTVGMKFQGTNPRGNLVRNHPVVTVVTHGIIQVHCLSYQRADGTRRGYGDYVCNGFYGDQPWFFGLYADYLSFFLGEGRPTVPTNDEIRLHFRGFWALVLRYARVSADDVPAPVWAL